MRSLEPLMGGAFDIFQYVGVTIHEFVEILDPKHEKLTACLGDDGGGARAVLDE